MDFYVDLQKAGSITFSEFPYPNCCRGRLDVISFRSE